MNKWTEEEIKILKDNYGKISVLEISKLLNKTSSAAASKTRKLQLPPSKLSARNSCCYTKNENFFDKESLISCYWGGFIAADGAVRYGTKVNKNGVLSFGLHIQDKCILEQFNKDTNYTGKISQYTRIDNHKYCRLNIFNLNNWGPNLKKYYNIVQNKTLILNPPTLSKLEHKLAYIIGYIDGDGCISISQPKRCKNKNITLSIAGTKSNLLWMSLILHKLEDINKYPNPANLIKIKSIYKIQYDYQRGFNLLKELDKILINIKLARKWNKVQEYEEYKRKNITCI